MSVPTRETPEPTPDAPLRPPPRPRPTVRRVARGAATVALVVSLGLAAAAADGYVGGHATAPPGTPAPVHQVVTVTTAPGSSPQPVPGQDPPAWSAVPRVDVGTGVPLP